MTQTMTQTTPFSPMHASPHPPSLLPHGTPFPHAGHTLRPAHQSGVRQGDQIRAVDGIECTNSAHHEVVGLIRDAVAHPKVTLTLTLAPTLTLTLTLTPTPR